MVLNDFCYVYCFVDGLHERVMDGQDQILKLLIGFELNDSQLQGSALIYVDVTAVILHCVVVGQRMNDSASEACSPLLPRKHAGS